MGISLTIFCVYLVVLVGIGIITFYRTKSYSGYTIAGRSNNMWVTAISAESSDMSGWLLLGLPGMAYASGYAAIWLVIGLLAGTLFDWVAIANRLRRATEYYNAITLMEFFDKRLGDHKRTVSLIACIVIVVFMIVNSSAEIIGSGKLLNAAFGFDYNIGIFIGVGIVLVYTFLGGFMAVSWSNLIQGTIMFFAIVLVPVVGLIQMGGWHDFTAQVAVMDPNMFSFTGGETGVLPIIGLVLGGVGISLFYPGAPHIITNFMAIKNPRELKASTLIAMVWVGLTIYGAVLIGMFGRVNFPDIADPEQVFLPLVNMLFPSALMGVFASAVMAAILSSVSAYLLVAAASFASSIYRRITHTEDDKKLVLVQRVAIIVLCFAALMMSFSGGLVYEIALFACAGFGACFAPLVLGCLYSKKVNRQGAVVSMIVGMIVCIVWYYSGLSNYIYEIIPATAVSATLLFTVSKATGGPNEKDVAFFEGFLQTLKLKKKNAGAGKDEKVSG
jgi:sodium/proline symporter